MSTSSLSCQALGQFQGHGGSQLPQREGSQNTPSTQGLSILLGYLFSCLQHHRYHWHLSLAPTSTTQLTTRLTPPPNHRQREMREMVLPPVTLLFRQKLPHFRDYCRESPYCVGGSPSQLSCYFLSATITTTAANDATFPSYQGHLFPTRLARVKEVLDFLDKYSHRNCHHRHIIVGGEYL